ncbi:cytoplasmic protein [Pasteurella atlantica]|uniref:Cytoplasmic protein n=2 Tax=Pasteurellaceae TaxID=712 RepID=A0ACC6HKW4_9PAST|nr:cytoplasmic protein [Pasteurella atlantica]MDP8051407.1 cytoplasmic protein [Pasteurella atlantica]MDP8104713.1 cytoplasmic protein [Pasteurella atlantica]MDP8148065.1 cytoplasmic protein [Pasteurella atlantica]
MNNQDPIKAHQHSSCHYSEIMKSEICGCFYCLKIFKPAIIKEWIDDETKTARCPYCDIDSVIGEKSGYPITKAFLQEMYDYWFV